MLAEERANEVQPQRQPRLAPLDPARALDVPHRNVVRGHSRHHQQVLPVRRDIHLHDLQLRHPLDLLHQLLLLVDVHHRIQPVLRHRDQVLLRVRRESLEPILLRVNVLLVVAIDVPQAQ